MSGAPAEKAVLLLRWAYALSLEQTGDYDGAACELRKIIAYDASFKGAQDKLASMTASSHLKP